MDRKQSSLLRSTLVSDSISSAFFNALIGAVIGVVFAIIAQSAIMQFFGQSPTWYHQVAFYGLLVLIFGCLFLIFFLVRRVRNDTHQNYDDLLSRIEDVQKSTGITVRYYS